jgi:hypothetical protein
MAVTRNGRARVLVIGLGDLGRRLALGLARSAGVGELILAGRDRPEAARFAALASACGTAAARFEPLDCLDVEAIAAVLRRERPDLVVQCAALLSPWAPRSPRAATWLAAAGFALQLPAQLPAVLAVMQAARRAAFDRPIVNCSFPDVTHPILAQLELAPTIGIGNVGMIAAVASAALRRLGRPADRVRVAAHHSHVTAVMTCDRSRLAGATHPRVFLDDAGTPADELAFAGPALGSSQDLNALSAAHGLEILGALLPGGAALATSAPGPHGLPGGWPVRIDGGRVALDLPPGLSHDAALRDAGAAAADDGVAGIAADGTVTFTEAAQRAVASVAPGLAAPLAPRDCLARFARLRDAMAAA